MPEDALAPVVRTLVTGHYVEGRSYGTLRSKGTADELLIYTVEGSGVFRHGEAVHHSMKGELTLLRAGTPHHYQTSPESRLWELLWVHFHPRPHWWAWLDWSEPVAGPRAWRPQSPQSERVDAAMREMHLLASEGVHHREDWAMNALERVLLEAAPQTAVQVLDPRVTRAISYMRSHLNQPIRMSEIAEHCHLSTSRLVHLFSAQTGQSPFAFLEAERLQRAAQLLALTLRRVASIAHEVGYADPLYFTRRFSARMGVSPRQYRAQSREEIEN